MTLRKIVLSLAIVVTAFAAAQEVRFDELSGSISARTAVSAAGSQVLTAGESFDDVTTVAEVSADSSLQRISLNVISSSAAIGSKSNILCVLTAF